MGRPDTDHYRDIFLRGAPLMDTRAPVEFQHGAFPAATNLPLMSDAEREQVGICYKERGQQAAIELGHSLVKGELREARLKAWCDFARAHPDGYLYCFRGGLRSQIVQDWMRESGIDFPRVIGGYKAMRGFLIDELERSLSACGILLVAGKTGTGKTRVIERVPRSIDLEALAHHRGSSFGRLPEGQPSQIDFENSLSIEFMRLLDQRDASIVLEDEGKLVGRLSLPEELRSKMQQAPLLVVEESLASRVEVILEDYIHDLGDRYRDREPELWMELHRQHLLEGLTRIRKRLGGALYLELEAKMVEAFEALDDDLHRAWIEALLSRYYDPMYEYQMSQRTGERIYTGTREEVISHLCEPVG